MTAFTTTPCGLQVHHGLDSACVTHNQTDTCWSMRWDATRACNKTLQCLHSSALPLPIATPVTSPSDVKYKFAVYHELVMQIQATKPFLNSIAAVCRAEGLALTCQLTNNFCFFCCDSNNVFFLCCDSHNFFFFCCDTYNCQ